MAEVRQAVFAGHKLRIHYAAVGRTPKWRTVDPIGLVTVREQGYLLATRSGADRTRRLSRIEPAGIGTPEGQGQRLTVKNNVDTRRVDALIC